MDGAGVKDSVIFLNLKQSMLAATPTTHEC
jgi:hypothetical protein